MAELDPCDGGSGPEDILGDDAGEAVLLLDEDGEEPAVSFCAFTFADLELLDEEKMAFSMMVEEKEEEVGG